MKKSSLSIRITLVAMLFTSLAPLSADEVAAGAFGGAATGALIGGAAGGGKGAGIGAGVGLGLGLMSGSAAKSRRQRRERRYRTSRLRDEEYAHEEIMPNGDLENDDSYSIEPSASEDDDSSDNAQPETANNAPVDTAGEDEYKHEEIMPGGDLEDN